jgi:hypothetical protein
MGAGARLVAALGAAVVLAAAGCTATRPPEPSGATGTSSGPAAGQAAIVARIGLPGPAAAVATGGGFVWALTRQPAPALWRIDPRSNRVVGEPTSLPADPWASGSAPGRSG